MLYEKSNIDEFDASSVCLSLSSAYQRNDRLMKWDISMTASMIVEWHPRRKATCFGNSTKPNLNCTKHTVPFHNYADSSRLLVWCTVPLPPPPPPRPAPSRPFQKDTGYCSKGMVLILIDTCNSRCAQPSSPLRLPLIVTV